MVYTPDLRPGNMIKVKDRKTKKPIKKGSRGKKGIYVWELRIELPKKKDSKRNIKTHRFIGTADEAEAELYKLRKEYTNSYRIDPEKVTFGDYLKQWLETRTDLEPRTRDAYKIYICSHIIPALGDILLIDLKPYDISNYRDTKLISGRLDGKEGGLDPGSVNKHLVVIHECLESASNPEKQIIPYNPAKLVKKARKSSKWKAAENYLTAKELNDLLTKLSGVYSCFSPTHSELTEEKINILREVGIDEKRLTNKRVLGELFVSRLYPVVFTAAYTGMRQSEILGLRWRDVNFATRTISVIQTSHYTDEGHHYGTTKEKKRKVVAMSKKLEMFLKKHKKIQNEEKLFRKDYEDNDMVFPDKRGRPIRNGTLSRIFTGFAQKNGIRINFHGLRHTHATLLLMSGIPVEVVSQRLGHQKTSTTLDEYSHAIPGIQEKAAALFDLIVEEQDILSPEKLLIKQKEAADSFDSMVESSL
ncbi:MAG: tyrosine-type recombinase/integrase [Christensenellaceae bacterium]|jgi:integrase